MSRVLPYPGLSFALAAFWLLLNNSLSPPALFGAAIIGLIAPWTLVPLRAERLRIRRFSALAKLAGTVIYDIVRSNFAVAAIIVSGAGRRRTAGFVAIPLDMTNQYALAALAIIITSTPGTLWAQHDAATRRLLLHVFDLVDEADWIVLVKGRYEPLLREIFE
ncbi:MAG TPA: Na+/H+ antiporter subunit E [Caulobacterales bacterium]|jgi:multicomponent K+:H+ antiporter subunit E|nr:Na+/H+ antiporter subunit E [Caulobacterales bacterium]